MSPPEKKKRSPLVILLVVLGLAGACIPCTGVLAAVAIPSFISYTRRAKTAEAQANVAAIAQGVAAAYAERGQLPPGLPPTPPAPPGSARELWPADADPGWAALGFAPADPLYYSYEYALEGSSGFVVRARGDLDGDGVTSLFERRGRVDPSSGAIELEHHTTVTDEIE